MTIAQGNSASLLGQNIDSFPDLLFLVSREGVILDYRGGHNAQLYAPPDAFLGRALNTVLPPPLAARLQEAVARVSNTQRLMTVDYTLPFPDGARDFEARLVPFTPGAILAVCRDVTETPGHNARLSRQPPEAGRAERPESVRQQTDQRLRRLAESIEQVLWLRDACADRMLYVSPGFEQIFGRPAGELYADARLWMQAIHPDDRSWAAARYEAWLSGSTTAAGALTYRIVRPNGEIRWLQDAVTAFSDGTGFVQQVGGVARDVTAQRGLSEEFNDALSVIIGDTQVARELSLDSQPVRECLDRVLAAVRTVEMLVLRIETLAGPSSGRSAAGPAPVAAEAAGLLPEASPLAAPDSPLDDWHLMLRMRPNVLIEGDRAATEAMLQRLLPHCVEPALEWKDVFGDARPATLIVRDVGNLSISEQQRLLRWLEAGERPQVLSTSNLPLFAQVARGRFMADLFYRLNLLRLDV